MIDPEKHGRALLKLHGMVSEEHIRIHAILLGVPGTILDLHRAVEGRPVVTSLEELWAEAVEALLMVGALKGIPMEQALAESLRTLREAARNVRRSRREATEG